MKKMMLLLAAIGLFSVASQAQLRIGGKIGINTTGVSGSDIKNSIKGDMTGFYVGPSVEWMHNGKIGLDASLLYAQRGVHFKNSSEKRMGYLDIPVNVKYMHPILTDNFKFFISAGPYISFRVAGDKKFDVITDDIQGQWKAKTFGAGLNFNGGFEILRLVQVGFDYGLGLTDNYKASDGDYSAKERGWSIYAAVYL